MTWTSFRGRGEILRDVTVVADARADGTLPWDVEGVACAFADQLDLLGALQLRWHTRLAGRIERELSNQPLGLEQAVITAWRATARELPGVRAIIDRHRERPLDPEMAQAMTVATSKEHELLAVMAGRAALGDPAAARVGAEIEDRARAGVALAA
ncbi:hypothetical protein [Nocardioides sp.]|uniref:hypothetical protein n=1 Tax=Nocardioides sp. TaxID=35761 RepID=UPI002ED6270E